jgi:hypothetical protein
LLIFGVLALRYRLGKGAIGSFYIFLFFFPSSTSIASNSKISGKQTPVMEMMLCLAWLFKPLICAHVRIEIGRLEKSPWWEHEPKKQNLGESVG